MDLNKHIVFLRYDEWQPEIEMTFVIDNFGKHLNEFEQILLNSDSKNNRFRANGFLREGISTLNKKKYSAGTFCEFDFPQGIIQKWLYCQDAENGINENDTLAITVCKYLNGKKQNDGKKWDIVRIRKQR